MNTNKIFPVVSVLALVASLGAVSLNLGHKSVVPSGSAINPDELKKVLVEHPDILLEAAQSIQSHRDEQVQKNSVKLVADHASELFDVPQDRFIGNPNGKHVVAIFFDYQCPHCREAEPGLHQAVTKDPELKLVFHEFPVINQFSIVDTAAALAAAKQGKYMAFHDAMMEISPPYNIDKLNAAADKAGVNRDQMTEFMKSSELNGDVSAVLKLGNNIGINATPAFALKGGGVMLGWTDLDRFQKFVDQAGK